MSGEVPKRAAKPKQESAEAPAPKPGSSEPLAPAGMGR